MHEADDELLHPVEGVLVFFELVGQLHHLQLKLLDLLLEERDLQGRVVLDVSFGLEFHLWREDAVDHALGTHDRLLL